MEEKAAGKTEDARPKGKRPPRGLVQDELMLKFVGTAMLIVGLVILVAAVVAISVLSILHFDVAPWLLVVPLSVLVVAVGAIVNGHYRRVVDRVLNPKPPAPAPRPNLYAYPYGTPPAGAPQAAPPPAPQMYPSMYAPAYPPMGPYAIPVPPGATSMRYCGACGQRIPVDSKFCPYCRRPS